MIIKSKDLYEKILLGAKKFIALDTYVAYTVIHVLTYAQYVVLPIAPNVFRLELLSYESSNRPGSRSSSARDDRDQCPR